MSENNSIAKRYYQCGEKDFGSPLKIFNTNYRTIYGERGNTYTGFAKGFVGLEDEEGKDRADFQKSDITGQEVNKQHTVRMRNSWLFQERDGVFYKTKRGNVFSKMLHDAELTLEERKLLSLILILPGYFYDIPNYLCRRTDKLFAFAESAGYTTQNIINLQTDFLLKGLRGKQNKELWNHDYFYIANFIIPYCTEPNLYFVKHFYEADDETKKQVKDFAQSCADKRRNLLAKKYESGGNFTMGTLLETTWVMLLCKTIKYKEIESFEDFIDTLIKTHASFYTINESRVKCFIELYHSVFEVIYRDVYDIKENTSFVKTKRTLTKKEVEEIGIIDPTDNDGQEQLKQVSETLKSLARQANDYHCIMEAIERCRYFTSKETNHNYIEVHHLIPRAVANRFTNSIEILSNYVPLCPYCHRKIHLAQDREREYMINFIYNARKNELEEKGITIDKIEELYSFYGIAD